MMEWYDDTRTELDGRWYDNTRTELDGRWYDDTRTVLCIDGERYCLSVTGPGYQIAHRTVCNSSNTRPPSSNWEVLEWYRDNIPRLPLLIRFSPSDILQTKYN